MEPRNRCQGINSASLYSLAGRYDNPVPSRCLAPMEFLKIPARYNNPIPPRFLAPIDYLKIPALNPKYESNSLTWQTPVIPWDTFCISYRTLALSYRKSGYKHMESFCSLYYMDFLFLFIDSSYASQNLFYPCYSKTRIVNSQLTIEGNMYTCTEYKKGNKMTKVRSIVIYWSTVRFFVCRGRGGRFPFPVGKIRTVLLRWPEIRLQYSRSEC